MHFVIGFPLSTDWNGNNYNSILAIINRLTKIEYYKLVKVTISLPKLAEVIIDVVIWHHSFRDSIINDWGAIFTSKFRSLLCYLFDIKK